MAADRIIAIDSRLNQIEKKATENEALISILSQEERLLLLQERVALSQERAALSQERLALTNERISLTATAQSGIHCYSYKFTKPNYL